MNLRYLFVDLDGTLLAGDSLLEGMIGCLRQGPSAWKNLFSLFQGMAVFKQKMAVYFDPDLVWVREEIVLFIETERTRGTKIILATGAPRMVVERLAPRLPKFDHILNTDGEVNRVGNEKLKAMREITNGEPFAYIGNSLRSDRAIWSRAARVDMIGGILNAIYWQTVPQEKRGRYFVRSISWPSLIEACRPEQWVKNLLVFVPLFAGHVWLGSSWFEAGIGFFAFSFLCSFVYLANDLLDKPFDRAHPRKSLRPIAAGKIETVDVLVLGTKLLLASAVLVILLSSVLFAGALMLYVILAFAYSLALKRLLIVDILVLAGLYILRILAGSFLTNVPLSAWLLGVSLFAFASLAFLKRYASLRREEFGPSKAEPGRAYTVQDQSMLAILGIVSAFSALVMLALYIQSEAALVLYTYPSVLFFLIPLLLYLFSRVWMLAQRGEVKDDPVAFFLRDQTSYVVCLLCGLCVAIAF